MVPHTPSIPINKDNSGAEEGGPSALTNNPNPSLAERSTIRTNSQEKDSITDTPSPKTSKRVSFYVDTNHPTAPSVAPKPAAPKLLQMAPNCPENTFC